MSDNPDLESRLRNQYDKVMKKSGAAVFKTFETYLETLPRRIVGGGGANRVLRLYKLPYWADQSAVETMAKDLEFNRRGLDGDRNYVRYATEPTACGKTSSILPAFLNSAESGRRDDNAEKEESKDISLSYYIYIPFDNNNDRNYRAKGLPSGELAEQQGANFMYQCLAMFFQNKSGELDLAKNPVSINATKERFKHLLEQNAPLGKCLIHVDEHRSMVAASTDRADDPIASRFRRGALQTLAEVSGIAVVATFTDILKEMNPSGSFNVCRYPVAVPLLDIDAMAIENPAFDIQVPTDRELSSREHGILSSVRFRLACTISTLGFLSLHGHGAPGKRQDLVTLRNAFAQVVSEKKNFLKRLIALNKLLERKLASPNLESSEHASLVLCGVPEAEWKVDRKIKGLVLTPTGLVTVKLGTLLGMRDTNHGVYRAGMARFVHVFNCETSETLLASTPLEAAYTWAITVRSARDQLLSFGNNDFVFECERLESGRLFDKSFRENISGVIENLTKNTLYYAREGPGSLHPKLHPLVDLYFLTESNELVAIDVTAADDATFEENKRPIMKKRRRMMEWVKRSADYTPGLSLKLHAVMLAPFDSGSGTTVDEYPAGSVTILRKDDALFHLGGLTQLLFCFAPTQHNKNQANEEEEADTSVEV